ncbi:unnamed protein product [Cochlearia groenlandica]
MSYESRVSTVSTGTSSLRSKFPGLPKKCSCGEAIIQKMSKSERNPYRRYYRCLVNDGHVFKWIDEALVDEIEQLDYQVGVLEDEVGILTIEIKRQRKEFMIVMVVAFFLCFIMIVFVKLYN